MNNQTPPLWHSDHAQHAAILSAYISRLTCRDLAEIAEASRSVADAQAYQGNRGQLAAQEALRSTVRRAANLIGQHDLSLIGGVVDGVRPAPAQPGN